MNLVDQSPAVLAFEQEKRHQEALERSTQRRKKAPKKPDALTSASDAYMARLLNTPVGIPQKMTEIELYDVNTRKPDDFLERVATGRTVIVPAD